ncbi:c-type cytochrome [Shimia sp. W99]|uniref:Cytochrome C oxidase, cbb3-type, subunit III n=1 Tax=Shimia aestuarii TaxID=254406 RepID=A0A1I4RKF9_9RHOB|nr:c-type cytochrome [Shimia aestuarii]SFM52725.1 Cytochrome C oxidase, cbb3-type, subunit III [Shimia aestuarii]
MKYWMMAAALGVGAMACAEAEMPEAPEGEAIFAENCALCHGAGGRGDGAIAAGLRPRPSDLTQISRRAGGAFPVAEVLSQIDGYERDAIAGVDMPEFGALLEGDLVPVDTGDGVMTPTPRPLAALLAYLESIQR